MDMDVLKAENEPSQRCLGGLSGILAAGSLSKDLPPTAAIEPVIDEGVIRNSAGTILGADNKSAVAVMLEGARRVLAENKPHAGIELLFTPKEEVGLLGAAAFDHQRFHARLGYVYDQAAPIGEVILGAPYSRGLIRPWPRRRWT